MVSIDRQTLGALAVNTSGTTHTLNTDSGATVVPGAYVLVGVSGYGNTLTSCALSGAGLSWTTLKQGRAGSPGSPFVALAGAFAPDGLGGSDVLVATYNASSQVRVIGAASLLGVDPADPLGNVSGPVGVSPAAQAWSTGSVVLEDGSMLVGLCFNEVTNAPSTPNAGTDELHESGHADGFRQVLGYRVEAAGGSFAVGGSWGSSAQSTTIGVELRASQVVPQSIRPDADLDAGGWAEV